MSAPHGVADFDYALPPDRIAQHPLSERDAARMMVLDRRSGACRHATVRDLPSELEPGDLVVMNATRVDRARLRGTKETGGRAEALLLGATGLKLNSRRSPVFLVSFALEKDRAGSARECRRPH